MRERARIIGLVVTNENALSATMFLTRKHCCAERVNVGRIIVREGTILQADESVLGNMVERGIQGIMAEFTGENLLIAEFMRVGKIVPMVVMIDWKKDRKRILTEGMGKSGLGVVRYDLAELPDLQDVYGKAWGELIPMISARREWGALKR
jgi:hypothetical protein